MTFPGVWWYNVIVRKTILKHYVHLIIGHILVYFYTESIGLHGRFKIYK